LCGQGLAAAQVMGALLGLRFDEPAKVKRGGEPLLLLLVKPGPATVPVRIASRRPLPVAQFVGIGSPGPFKQEDCVSFGNDLPAYIGIEIAWARRRWVRFGWGFIVDSFTGRRVPNHALAQALGDQAGAVGAELHAIHPVRESLEFVEGLPRSSIPHPHRLIRANGSNSSS